jgi:hypothetical protein
MYMLPAEGTLLTLKFQDGLKHLDAPSLSGESVLISSLNLHLSHRVSEMLIPEVQGEIRGRTSIHNESGVFPSEEAYLRGSVGTVLKTIIFTDLVWKAFYHYRFTNFEDFDPFDRRCHLMGTRIDLRLLPGATVSAQYSLELVDFYKWDQLFVDEDRSDTLNDVSLFIQFYKYLLFDIVYSYQENDSSVAEYSYKSNKLALLMAKSLPYDMVFQLYALIRSKNFSLSFNGNTSKQVEAEDDERGGVTLKLSKDINSNCALEAQYDLRRSSSYRQKDLYTKNVFSVSLAFQF